MQTEWIGFRRQRDRSRAGVVPGDQKPEDSILGGLDSRVHCCSKLGKVFEFVKWEVVILVEE